MLQSLYVKNLALIKEAELEFGQGLNILTGETGAGKSLLLGSINLALGAKFDADMLGKNGDNALVELTFTVNDKIRGKLAEMDLECEEDSLTLSRKMQVGKSVLKVNGETASARQVKELAEFLIDIHGQHEHQSLLKKKKHLQILDAFCAEEIEEPMAKLRTEYRIVSEIRERIAAETIDENARKREQALAEFEVKEILAAGLIPGEDEELERKYRLMSNSKRIVESLSESYAYTGSDSQNGAGNALSRALRHIRSVAQFDERLEELAEQLTEIDNLLADYNRDAADFMAECEFDEWSFSETEERLNEINRLKGKYGNTVAEIQDYCSEKQKLLDKYGDYDCYMAGLREELRAAGERLDKLCGQVSGIRKKNAPVLQQLLKDSMLSLNFLTVDFEIAVRENGTVTSEGYDEVEFLISTNPGESRKPLGNVASGGELSRIMLAIKTVLAQKDDIDTLIFDEIDSGISGKTAWQVSKQLNSVAGVHQVICITHLPQIASMADKHFCIEKSASNLATITEIRELDDRESLEELARLLGSDSLTEAALENAVEMKKQAIEYKR